MPDSLGYFLFALALLTSPDEPEPVPEAARPLLFAPMRHLAVSMDLLSEKESGWHLHLWTKASWRGDLENLRCRYRDVKDAPPSTDARLFPTAEHCQKLIDFNVEHQSWLDAQVIIFPWKNFDNWIAENRKLKYTWELVKYSTQDYHDLSKRRLALKHLRHTLGDDAYYRGQLPPHVPVWRFQRIN